MTNKRDEVLVAAERLRDQVSKQPYLTLGLAGALGYFVGRSVPIDLAEALVGVGAQTALASAVESFFRDIVEKKRKGEEKND